MSRNLIIGMVVLLLLLSVIAVSASQLRDVASMHHTVQQNRIGQWVAKSEQNKQLYERYLKECKVALDSEMELKEEIEAEQFIKMKCVENKEYSEVYEVIKNIDYSNINIPFPLSLFKSDI